MRKRLAILALLVTVALAVGCSATDPYTDPVYTSSDVHVDGKVYVKGVVNPWESLGLPDQTGHAGDFLATDGSTADWDTLAGGGDMSKVVYDPAGKNTQVIVEGDVRLTDARTPTAHNQDANTITVGTLDGDRLPAISQTKLGGVTATGVPSGKYLKDDGTWTIPTASAAWGSVTGTLSSQTDLNNALGGKEPTISTGDVGQYWRGDKTWQAFPTIHSHSNLTALDAIQEAFTTALKSAYDGAVSASHVRSHSITSTADHTSTASQGYILKADANGLPIMATNTDGQVSGAVNASHSHSNLTTLDAITVAFTTALKTSYDATVTASHSHSNKSVLDATQESFTTALKTSYDWLVTNITSAWKTTVDSFISSKGQVSGLASLDASSKVVQDPANAQAAAAQNKIPIGGAGGALATGWIPDLSGTYQATSGKDATGGYAGLTLFKINFKNVANTITSWFTNTNTIARTYTFQDRDGTIADNTDITAQIPDSIGTAKGDLIGFSASGTPVNVPYSGVNNNVLTVDTTTASGWKSAAPAGGSNPAWYGKFYAASGDCNPILQAQHENMLAVAGPTPTGIGITIGRAVQFTPPANITVTNIRLFCVGATTSLYKFAIYPVGAGSTKTWDSGTVTTVANTWLNLTTGLPVTLTAGTKYWWCVTVVSTGTTAGFRSEAAPLGTAYWGANVAPLGGTSLGLPVYAQFAVATGVFPTTLPTIAAAAYAGGTTGSVPFGFLDWGGVK